MANGGLDNFCLDASYINSFDILNSPSLASLAPNSRLPSLLGAAGKNISTYTSNALFDNFIYQPAVSLPLAKQLLIQCPLPACVFPISGYFTFLQRMLFYTNMLISLIALNVPILRGVAQIWLTSFWFSALGMFAATIIATKVPMIYNLDLQPAVIVVHTGLLPTLLWFSFRAEPGTPMTERRGKERNCFRRRILDYPVTRVLVPLYAVFGLANVVLSNVVQDSAGFWPKATAVVVENATSYLLTSPCFQDGDGAVGLWPPEPNPYTGIRNLTSLSIYYPPAGMKAVDALLAVPQLDLTILHVGTVLLCFVIILLSLKKLTWLQRWLHKQFPCLRPQTIRFLATLPFVVPLILATTITLYIILVFETNARRAQLPENEAYSEIGQWGPYVTAFLVLIATLVAKFKGWDFDVAESNSGFKWLLGRDGENGYEEGRESQESLMKRYNIPYPELWWGGLTLEMRMRREIEKENMKRVRTF